VIREYRMERWGDLLELEGAIQRSAKDGWFVVPGTLWFGQDPNSIRRHPIAAILLERQF